MTFFDKLFTSKNKLFKSDNNPTQSCTRSSDGCPRLELGVDQVRVVLFRECERRGRKLLYDSDAVEKIPIICSGRIMSQPDIVEVSPTHAYKYNVPRKDVSSLGEMIFGSVAVSHKVVTSKIHNIPSPSRLLFTTVVPTNVRCHPKSSKDSCSGPLNGKDPSSHDGSCASDSIIYRGCSIETPKSCGLLRPLNHHPLGLHRSSASMSLRTLAMGSSGCESRLNACPNAVRSFCENGALRSSATSSCYDSGGLLRCSVTSSCFENSAVCSAPTSRRPSDSPSCSLSSLYSSLGSQCDSKASNLSWHCSGGSLNSLRRRWNQSLAVSLDLSDEGDDMPVRVRTKLGLALILNIAGPYQAELEKFLLNNSLTVESILERLRERIESAYCRLDSFVQMSYAASKAAAEAVCEVVRGRQDSHPQWLHPCLTPARGANGSSRDKFVAAFCGVLKDFDDKATNFFVSTLVTAMLTHNLSWVSSVTADSSDSEHRQESQGGYNPLWAQHSELFGAVCTPSRAAKVIVADSRSRAVLSDLLDILAYFMRCVTVLEHEFGGFFDAIVDLSKESEANCFSNIEINSKRENPVDEMVEEKWTDDNFDSGVDCEMRDAVFASTLDTDLNPSRLDDLVSSAIERTVNHSLISTHPSINQTTDLEVNAEVKIPVKDAFWSRIFSKGYEKSNHLNVRTGEKGFVESFRESERSRGCCNSLKSSCSKTEEVLVKNPTGDCIDGLSRRSVLELELPQYCKDLHDIARRSLSPSEYASVSQHCKVATDESKGMFKAGNLEKDVSQELLQPCQKAKNVSQKWNYSHIPQEVTSLGTGGSLYPDIESLARLENVRLQDLTSERDRTLFVEEVLQMADHRSKSSENHKLSKQVKVGHHLEREKIMSEFQVAVNSPEIETSYGCPRTETDNILKLSQLFDNVFRREKTEIVNLGREHSGEASLQKYPLEPRSKNEFHHQPVGDSESRENNTIPRVKKRLQLSGPPSGIQSSKSPDPDDGYYTLYGDSSLPKEKDVLFMLGDTDNMSCRTIVTKSSPIEPETERPRRRRKCPTRSRTVNIPLVEGLKILHQRSRTFGDLAKECALIVDEKKVQEDSSEENLQKASLEEERLLAKFQELPMPCCSGPVRSRVLPICPVFGGVTPSLQPHQAIQAVTKAAEELEDEVRKDLALMAAKTGTAPSVSEAVYVVADMQKWAVSVHSSQRSSLGGPRCVRASASQLVADMLESFAHLHRLGFPAHLCLDHLERQLCEIYKKSQSVAELLMTTEFCTVDLVTSSLHLAVTDVPLLLSVATTHTPQIAEKYGISFS